MLSPEIGWVLGTLILTAREIEDAGTLVQSGRSTAASTSDAKINFSDSKHSYLSKYSSLRSTSKYILTSVYGNYFCGTWILALVEDKHRPFLFVLQVFLGGGLDD